MSERPNILLLTVDTLRADRLGCYGYAPTITPNLDRLAACGIRFDQAITGGSWTQAAFPVIMTSTYASAYNGCLGALSTERPSPIEWLAEAGYSTGGFSTSPLLSRPYGYNRGFHHFVDLVPGESDPFLRQVKGGQILLRQPLTHAISALLRRRSRPARLYATAAELTDAFCHWSTLAQRPFFSWVHYMDVHWPYHLEAQLTQPAEIARAWRDLEHLHRVNWYGAPMSAAQRSRYIDLYEEAVRYTDAQIGRLLEHLETTGLLDNTMIVVTADHGEEFMEHGRWGHWENNLHDEILRVPLLIRLPQAVEPRVIAQQVRLLDLMPTLLDLVACPSPEGMEGTSMAPLWNGNPDEYEPTVSISEMWRDEWHIVAVRTESFKYIWDSREPDSPRLYDFRRDPGERDNLAERLPDRVHELHDHVKARLQQRRVTNTVGVGQAPDLDDELMARLRGLGYVE